MTAELAKKAVLAIILLCAPLILAKVLFVKSADCLEAPQWFIKQASSPNIQLSREGDLWVCAWRLNQDGSHLPLQCVRMEPCK
jgi:hypothetical protein